MADASVTRWRVNGGFDYFEGAHDGYRPLEHRRHVLALHGDLLVVADLVDDPDPRSNESHAAAVHWHIDPRWRVEPSADGAHLIAGRERVSLHSPQAIVECFRGDEETGLGWHAPVYGRLEPATTIRLTKQGAAPLWTVSVFGLNDDNAVETVETLPVWAEAGVLAHSTAVRITRRQSTDYLVIAEPAVDAAAGESGQRTWRVGELETDAHVLFCRVGDGQQMTRVAIVDGSVVRSSFKRGVQLALPEPVSDLHLDMQGSRWSDDVEHAHARMAGSVLGATLLVAGVEWPIAGERRAAPRATSSRQRFTS
jgi:hypothetical protein